METSEQILTKLEAAQNELDLVDRYRQLRATRYFDDGDLAGDFLLSVLWEHVGGHDRLASEIRRMAEAIGFSWGLIRKLKAELGITSYRRSGKWWWHCPPEGNA